MEQFYIKKVNIHGCSYWNKPMKTFVDSLCGATLFNTKTPVIKELHRLNQKFDDDFENELMIETFVK